MADEDTVVDRDEAIEDQELEPQGELSGEEQEPEADEELSKEEQAMAKLKGAIVVAKDEIGPLRLKLTVTVPREHLDERLGEEFAELKRDAMVPGFRKGHAPLKLVEKRFAPDVGDQLLAQLIGRGYAAAVEKEELKTLGDPLFWVRMKEERVGEDRVPRTVQTEKLVAFDKALDHVKMPKDGDLTFACEVELKPEFELPELEKIPVKRPVIKVTKKDVDAELRRFRGLRGAYVPVADGPVEAGDMLYVDFTMSVGGDVIEHETSFELAARDVQVKGIALEGFGDAVVGKKADESFTFEADIPEDYENIDIRGKKAAFAMTVREIKRLELPPIDEDFLREMGMETEKELRDIVKTTLESQIEEGVQRAMREQIGRYLVESTKLDIPEGLSQRQTERSIALRGMEMLRMGYPQAEVDKAIDEMRGGAQDQAVRDLKLFFILEKIAEEREVEVREEELNAAIAQIAMRTRQRFDRVRDHLSKGDGLTTLYLKLRDERVLTSLIEQADITETTPPKKSKKK